MGLIHAALTDDGPMRSDTGVAGDGRFAADPQTLPKTRNGLRDSVSGRAVATAATTLVTTPLATAHLCAEEVLDHTDGN